MVVWEIGEVVAAARIVPWPCRRVHGPGEAGVFLWRGVVVELDDVLVDGLNNFRRLAFFAGIESHAVILFDWDLRSVRKGECVRKLRLLPRGSSRALFEAG